MAPLSSRMGEGRQDMNVQGGLQMTAAVGLSALTLKNKTTEHFSRGNNDHLRRTGSLLQFCAKETCPSADWKPSKLQNTVVFWI
jgi:hypothetical protein